MCSCHSDNSDCSATSSYYRSDGYVAGCLELAKLARREIENTVAENDAEFVTLTKIKKRQNKIV